MSGHSKWATTKRKKAAVDAKRGKIFTKFAKLITIAARDGKSGDPANNPSLRMAIDNAKSASMPKDNIERAIQRGIGGGSAAAIEEVTYEAYAPGGVAVLINCLTDNKNRTLGEIKAILNKNNGTLATSGSVGYLFRKIGQILIDKSKNELSDEDIELAIIESEAKDFETEDEYFIVSCDFTALHRVRSNLESAKVKVDSTEIIEEAVSLISVSEEERERILSLIEKIEDIDDVVAVFSNLEL